ncbi:MAG: response regulator transcription factor [Defluviitaleaceae bacterium]|nr:response regulator transcription factor [Defluviitaleaceae bacterium]
MDKILVVEDDIFINELLCELLVLNGYTPTPAFSGTEALLCLQSGSYALVILDLMLPGKTGDEVLHETRKSSNIPVIALTAVADKESAVRLLHSGADDYIVKPFDNDELLARIAVQLRRENSAPTDASLPTASADSKRQLRFKDIILDLDGYDAHINGTNAKLSKREFEILHLMMSHPQKVFTKNNLYESVWGEEFMGDDNTINVHISKLRAKLSALNPSSEYILTVWGIGFKMAVCT